MALGYELVQDIPIQIGKTVSHGDDWHEITLSKTKNGLLQSVAEKTSTLYVNSYHHQAVIFKDDGPLQIAARSKDGVTEATEFKNGRGLLLQFHPEYMEGAPLALKNHPKSCATKKPRDAP